MSKLLYLGLGAVGLYIVIGGIGSIPTGSVLLPIAGLAVIVGLFTGKQKRHAGSSLLAVVVLMFVVFGFALRSGLIR